MGQRHCERERNVEREREKYGAETWRERER